MSQTLYRRALPADAIAFSSPEGREVFAAALAAGGLGGYFPLAEQFHTQADPAYCGLGSLVVALNALAIDPGRLWKGPWRWFGEELLDCCVPLEEVRRRGLDLDELACLARCNGATVKLARAEETNLPAWREALAAAATGTVVLIASYDRASLGQTGSGHFSPVGGFHASRDLALLLDVARFKYPPHWVSAEKLWRAMHPHDPSTGRPRGWLTLEARSEGIALGFSLRCEGDSWRGIADRLVAAARTLEPTAALGDMARALVPLHAQLELRTPTAEAHREALARAREAVRALPGYDRVRVAVGEERAEGVTMLLLAASAHFVEPLRDELARVLGDVPAATDLGAELANLRAQLAALWAHAAEPRN